MKHPPGHFGLLLLVGAVALRGVDAPAPDARTLAVEGVKAHEAKDETTFLAKMEAAVALRPDYPRMLVNLAAAQVANDRLDDAIATLGRLAALGVHSPVDKSDDFIALRTHKDFPAVVARLAENLKPKGAGEIAFTLPGMTGLIEGIAWREKTREYFFGDVNSRCVWVRTPDGKVRRFSKDDDALLGVFGLVVDEEHGTLWAATSAVPAMQGFTDGQKAEGGIAELDLTTGQVRRIVKVLADDRDHVLGDLALAPDGSVYASDSVAPILWRFPPDAKAPEPWIENPGFASLQGLAFADEGRTLYVSDHVNGIFRIEVATRAVRPLATPPDTTLLGLDALVRAPDGTLVTVQNGLRPMRVLRVTLDAAEETITQVSVLEAAHMTMAGPALGCMVKNEFFFIGNAGWSRFETVDRAPTPPRPVPVFHTKIELPPVAK